VFLPNTPLATQVGPAGLKAQAESIFFYFDFDFIFWAGPAQPVWAGLNPAGPAWSLAQASDPAGQSMRELVHACMAQCEGN
jgi:hypothetical protein